MPGSWCPSPITAVRRRSLVGWAVLMLIFSLPDASASSLNELLPLRVPGGVIPVLSLALLAVWSWVIAAAGVHRPRAFISDAIAASR